MSSAVMHRRALHGLWAILNDDLLLSTPLRCSAVRHCRSRQDLVRNASSRVGLQQRLSVVVKNPAVLCSETLQITAGFNVKKTNSGLDCRISSTTICFCQHPCGALQ